MEYRELDLAKAVELIKDNDLEGLRREVYDAHDPDEYMCAGPQTRQLIAMIALAERPSKELLEFGFALVLPWVEVTPLCEMLDVMLPRANIIGCDLSPSDKDWANEVITKDDASIIELLDDTELITLIAHLYATPQLNVLLPEEKKAAIAKRVFELSRQSDLNYFFGSGKRALLAFAAMMWDVFPENADEYVEDRVKPPYAED